MARFVTNLSFAFLLLIFSLSVSAQDFQNFSCTPGTELSRLPGENNRTMYIDYADGHLITNRHSGGVLKVWDISDPFNPFLQREYANGWTSSHVHSYLPGGVLVSGWGGWSHLDINDVNNIQLLNPLFDRRDSSMTYSPVGFRGVPGAYGYNRDLRTIDIVDLRTGNVMSTINVLDETGFIGRPNMIGNLLIITGDNEMPEGVATYDISDLSNPRLLDTIRTTSDGQPLNKAYDSTPVWGNYVVLSNNGDTGGSIRAVDIIDFSDPANLRHVRRILEGHSRTRYAQFQDEFMFVGDAKVDMSQPEFPLVEEFPDGDGEYNLPIGNMLVTSGMDRSETLRVWCHQSAPDQRAPMVTYSNPAANQTNVALTGRVGLVIPETLDHGSVDATTVFIRPVGGNPIAADISWTDHDVMNVTPSQNLQVDTTYEVVLPAGGISDVAGNAMEQDFSFRFSTGSTIDSDEPTPDPPAPGDSCQATIRAQGDTGEETMSLLVDGQALQTWTVGTDVADYTMEFDRTGNVEVAFTNDGITEAGGDKNIRVDFLQLGTARFEAEDQVENSGVYANDACGGGTNSERLHCDGEIGFGVLNCPEEPANGLPTIIDFSASDSRVELGTSVDFTIDASGNGALQYSYEFGDGNERAFSDNASASHTFSNPGIFSVRVVARDEEGNTTSRSFNILVHEPVVARGQASSSIAVDTENQRIWNVNPDNNTVTAINMNSLEKILEVPVSSDPRSIAIAGDGSVWVSSHDEGVVDVLSAATGDVIQRIDIAPGSELHGLIASKDGNSVYVAGMATGLIYRLDVANRQLVDSLEVGPWPRALALSEDDLTLLATRFISSDEQGEIYRVNTQTFDAAEVIALEIDSTSDDTDQSARGVPNYLTSIAIGTDGQTAWVTSKKDNIAAGNVRDGSNLTFETSIRSTVSLVDLESGSEITGERLDIDNQEIPSSIAFSTDGGVAYIALQGNNEVIAFDVATKTIYDRIDVGLAPQGLVVDPTTDRVFAHNFLSRSVTTIDLFNGAAPTFDSLELVAEVTTVANEVLSPSVLQGKQVFYNADDERMSADGYLSCATCHLDGGHDGRTWDFTQRGEGLRNTTDLRGRRGLGHGRVHWSANFDEIQDFENDIRAEFGGMGFLSDEQFNAGTRNQPEGDPKAGLSEELDALAAYVTSLENVGTSPFRQADGSLSADAQAGQDVFQALNCQTCHTGEDFTDSATGAVHDVGTIKPSSGQRLNETLVGIDTPTLKGLWSGAPYFHDGSAATLRAVIDQPGHGDASALTDAQKAQLVAYLSSIDDQASAGQPTPPPAGPLTLAGDQATPSQGVSIIDNYGAADIGTGEWVSYSSEELGAYNQVSLMASTLGARTIELRAGSPDGDMLASITFEGAGWDAFNQTPTVPFSGDLLDGRDLYVCVSQTNNQNLTINLGSIEISYSENNASVALLTNDGALSPDVETINGWDASSDISRDEWVSVGQVQDKLTAKLDYIQFR